jgi:uncharacterized membrane protein
VFLAVHAAYSFGGAYPSFALLPVASGLLSGVTAIGLWLSRRWSQYPVYVIAAFLGAYFIWYMVALVDLGWPYEDNIQSVASLVPAGLLLIFAVGASAYVFRRFRRQD